MRASEEKIIDKINDIIFKKNNVEVVLNFKKIKISRNFYTDNYLYKGKDLTLEDVQKLENEEKYFQVHSYLNRLLINRTYFKKELVCKLQTKFKNLSNKHIDEIISEYDKNNLINENDKAYQLVDTLYLKGYSKNYIETELKKNDVKDEKITDYINQTCLYDDKFFNDIIVNIYRKDTSMLIKKRKDKTIKFFLMHGFSKNQFISCVDKFYNNVSIAELNEDKNKMKVKLKSDYHKIRTLLERRYKNINNDKELENMCIKKLLTKGYSYDEIKEVIASNFNTEY